MELERVATQLWELVARESKEGGDTGGPAMEELGKVVDIMRRMDDLGTSLAPGLYRPPETVRGHPQY